MAKYDDLEDEVTTLGASPAEDNSDLEDTIRVPHTAMGNTFAVPAESKQKYSPISGETLQLGPVDTGIPTSPKVENTFASAGRELNQSRLGLKQYFAPFLDQFTGMQGAMQPGVVPQSIPQGPHSRAVNQEIQDTNTYDQPSREAPGGLIGGALGRGMETAAVPGGLLGQAAAQGVVSYFDPVSGNPTPAQESSSRNLNAGIGASGALVGGAFGKAAGSLIKPFKNALSSSARDALGVLRKNGIDQFDVAQATGSPAANAWKRLIQDHPMFGSTAFADEVQKPQITNQILKRYAGAEDPSTLQEQARMQFESGMSGRGKLDFSGASPDMLASIQGGAHNDLNGFFTRNPVSLYNGSKPIDLSTISGRAFKPGTMGTFDQALDQIEQGVRAKDVVGHQSDRILNIINTLRRTAGSESPTGSDFTPYKLNAAQTGSTLPVPQENMGIPGFSRENSVIPADTLEAAVSQSSKMSASDNPVEQEYGAKLSRVLRAVAKDQAASPEDFQAFEKANAHLHALHYIQGAIDPSENVNLPSLYTKLKNTSATGGRGPLYLQDLLDLAKAGKQVFPDKVGNSGTAARLLGPALLAGGVGAFEPATRGNFREALRRGGEFAGYGLAAPLIGSKLLYNAMPRNYAIWASEHAAPAAASRLLTSAGAGFGAAAPDTFNPSYDVPEKK